MCPAGHPLPLGLHDSARPVLPRPPTISNPPPLISSTKHPSVLERQMGAISQVRWEGQPPRNTRARWCPENSPFLFQGFGLSICTLGEGGHWDRWCLVGGARHSNGWVQAGCSLP